MVRQSFEATAREDWVALAERISDDCQVHDFDIPDAAGEVYRGPDGLLDWLAQWDRAWETWSIEDLDLREIGDDRVLALFRMVARGRDSGIEVNRHDAILYTVRGGGISRVEYYNDQQQALEAAGLPD